MAETWLTSLFVLLAIGLHVDNVCALNWTAQPFNPPSIPLAVKTPYLSAWLAQGSGAALNDDWPRFWTGSVCRV